MGTENVLVVDDNVDVRSVMVAQLASLGYRVTEASSGDEALALLEGCDGFDLLLSDIVMPGSLNGLDLARIVSLRWPQIKVLLASGYSGTAEVEKEAAAFPSIQKPFRKAELAHSVRLALAPHGNLHGAG